MNPQTRGRIVLGVALLLLLTAALAGGWYWYTHRTSGSDTTNGVVDFGRGTPNPSPSPSSTGGTLSNTTGGTPAPGQTVTNTTPNGGEPVLFSIHDKPIVSAVAFARRNVPMTRFMEQGSGNVYEYNFATKEKIRISNTSIPQIESAVWSADGRVVAMQYEQDEAIHTAVGILASTTDPNAPFEKIFFLPEGIRSVALSPDGLSVAYTSKTKTGSALVVARNDGSVGKILFSSPLSGWDVSWPTPTYVLVTSPLGEEGGVAYKITVADGGTTPLLVSPKSFAGIVGDAKGQLLATNPQTGFVALFDSKFGTFTQQSETTWPDKCSFVPNATSTMVCGAIPSAILHSETPWMQGQFASNDGLVATNFAYGYKVLLIPDSEYGDKKFDMVNVAATPGGSFVLFKNKTDGFLWGVRVAGGL